MPPHTHPHYTVSCHVPCWFKADKTPKKFPPSFPPSHLGCVVHNSLCNLFMNGRSGFTVSCDVPCWFKADKILKFPPSLPVGVCC